MGDALIHLPIRLTLKKTLQFRVIQNLLAPVERWSSKKNRARPHQARPNQAEEGLRSRCSDDDVIARIERFEYSSQGQRWLSAQRRSSKK